MSTTWENIIDARLAEVYGVDDATLQSNRRGRMTEAQRSRLHQMRWHRIRVLSRPLIVAFVFFLLLGQLSIAGFAAFLLGILRVLLLLIAISQAVRVIYFYYRTTTEIAEGKIRMYPGRLNKVVWKGIRILFCERGEFYHLPRREWDAFDHYGRYRVYSTPYTNVILAAQPVHRDEPLPEAWKRGDDENR